MNNIYVFRILVSLLCVFFTAFPLAGETQKTSKPETSYVFSISPVFGFLYGQVEELVYKASDSDTLLSQLIWDIKPLFLWGFSADLTRRYPLERVGFVTNLSARFSFSTRTGIMEDRDWLAPGDRLSHFSSHDNYTRWAMLMDLKAGISVPAFSRMLFKFYGGFNYMYYNWIAMDGYYQYGTKISNDPLVFTPWHENIPKDFQYGQVISYTQHWFIISPGVSWYIPYRFFAASINFQISPLVFCLGEDNHPLKKMRFNDYMFGGIFLEPSGEFMLSLHKNIDLSVYVSYRFIKGPRGSTITKTLTNNVSVKDNNKAGTAYSALSGGLSLNIRI
jgi:outer membrane protease